MTDPTRTWDLTDIYPGIDAWEVERRGLVDHMRALDAYRGRLGDSATVLADALELLFDLTRTAEKLHTYASLLADEDLRRPAPQGMRQTIEALLSEFAASSSWLDPELLLLPTPLLQQFVAAEPRLAVFRRYLDRLERRRTHTLDTAGERLMGLARLMRGDGETVSGLLRNAEIPWPEVTLSDGARVRLDPSGYTQRRSSAVRADREVVFREFHGQLQAFQGSLAATLYASVKEHVFEARARRFPNCLTAALDGNEVDPQVYRMLVDEVNAALPALHRYLQLRRRILGLDDLSYHDLYNPLVPEVDADYSWEAARTQVLESLAPLGRDYTDKLRHALTSRWVDVDARPGKRAGGYVNDGAYGVHPYMLLNHHLDYQSASTLAHEAGHLMHSWLSHERQPYPTARYVIFVAEVASTFNEALFFRHALARATSDATRLPILGNYLENLRGTVFRQTMFAEFELVIHTLVERGEALTGEILNRIYLDLLRRYHGSADGVMAIDELYGAEWGFVPHFHYDFYVYQYATSFVAATALSRKVLAQEPGALERYLRFLAAGATHPPVELLRQAGVDMTSPEPIRATIHEMCEVMDEIEAILTRCGAPVLSQGATGTR